MSFCNCPTCESDDCEPLDDMIRTCSRVDCAFQWVSTGTYIECPRCELREARGRIAVLELESATARAA